MSYGTLYGVGVGPGASDLITLRALDTLKRVPVIAIPRSSPHARSTAWRIVQPHLGTVLAQERVFLHFPMAMDPDRVRGAVDTAVAEIGARLETGRSVGFITEGDPSVYSTFIYVARAVSQRWPEVDIEIIPGVTSITAVPAVSGVPLADGQERIAIVPAAYGVDDLEAILDAFDTVVVMKIGPAMERVVTMLERKGLIDQAVYVARATMHEQQIVRDVRQIRGQRGGCFSMIVIARKDRSGLLVGEVPPGQRWALDARVIDTAADPAVTASAPGAAPAQAAIPGAAAPESAMPGTATPAAGQSSLRKTR